MTDSDKQLLLRDLCGRMPYGVVCKMGGNGYETVIEPITYFGLFQIAEDGLECKPYLRHMSSMTADEEYEFSSIHDTFAKYGSHDRLCALTIGQINWLNVHNFDYRGLIEKGLAIEAPEGMYKF